VRGAFEYQGQKCSAASRAYIPESVWLKIRNKLIEQTQELRMGDVRDLSNFVNAVIDERAFDKITRAIHEAKYDPSQAQILAGGSYDKTQGYFVRPTLIECSDPHYITMKQELFGPVLSLHVYKDSELQNALELCATSSEYALTGAIFSQDSSFITKASHQLRHAAGNFYINDKPTGAVVGQQPFGGGRASGTNDKAGSALNLYRWISARTIKTNLNPPKHYQYPCFVKSE
jgi:1-pyrroline-5-carboxylate dehydrogenase